MSRKVHLTQRDLRILEELVGRRAATVDELHQRHFGAWKRKSAHSRLGALRRAGYLEHLRTALYDPDGRLADPHADPQSVYLLGPKAPAALKLRSLAGDALRDRRFSRTLRETSVPHQIATNQIGDRIGAQLLPEHLLPPAPAAQRRHRPDATYLAAEPDPQGRQLVYLEVDLGHYNRDRILGKVQTFLAADDARSIVFAVPTDERAATISRWIRERYGDHAMHRIQPLTFKQLRRGGLLDPGTHPAADHADAGPTTVAQA